MISVKRRIEVKNTPTGKRLVLASSAAASWAAASRS